MSPQHKKTHYRTIYKEGKKENKKRETILGKEKEKDEPSVATVYKCQCKT